ncbi:porin [Paralcaligenes ureilyticus]|uniref:Putative porin n=1 Tax=Paralcaligenes ureilyticus TaxID=627131 RepID=A0A4R3LT84_9BURK|nr:porin [Paralcaligenes ureilyticus]TCT03794.1 putative porin [Paralcaligenes ureilyticus]
MKKTLLAAALIAGFASVAQAETSVTLYGIIDTGIEYQQVKGTVGGVDVKASQFGLTSGNQSGSRWGLKGSEDLGNGLRAVFQLESGFDSTNGKSAQGGRLFGRQATIGLASDAWGQLDFGRQTNIASKYMAFADPFAAGWGQANYGTSFTSANTVRLDNMIMYQTPNFSGFQFGVGYSFNVDGSQLPKLSSSTPGFDGSDRNVRDITVGLRYTNGPIGLGAAYDRLNRSNNPDGEPNNVSAWMIAGAYDFEVVKASLAFGQTRNGFFAPQGVINPTGVTSFPSFGFVNGLKFNSYLVGLTAPVGNGLVMASWQMADPHSSDDSIGDRAKQQSFSLGYQYSLSKRTNVYATASYMKNAYFQSDLKSTAAMVGIRHQF